MKYREEGQDLGILAIVSGAILITDDPDMERTIIRVNTPSLGEYTVHMTSRTYDNGAVEPAELSVTNAGFDIRGNTEEHELVVDSGFVLLACSGLASQASSRKQAAQFVASSDSSEQVSSFLTDELGVSRGIIIAPSLGDGVYRISVARSGNLLCIRCFLV
jgi:hypothetical protein